jgi:hypothetical protein
MKKFIARNILSNEFQSSLLASPLRSLIRWSRRFFNYSPYFLTDMQVVERPHYAWCMIHATELAKRLGYSSISGIEFGVAGGNGLLFMRTFADLLEKTSGIKIECYGFDSGKGMPDPEGWRDLPYWFRANQYKMDEQKLRSRLGDCKLVIGDIRDTVDSFVSDFRPAPIAFVFNDTDYYSSTLASLLLFRHYTKYPECFSPRIFQYYDDVIGTAWEMYGECNGQLAAINDFNQAQEDVVIHRNENLMKDTHLRWRFQIFYGHLLRHPDYNKYIGGSSQANLENALSLR